MSVRKIAELNCQTSVCGSPRPAIETGINAAITTTILAPITSLRRNRSWAAAASIRLCTNNVTNAANPENVAETSASVSNASVFVSIIGQAQRQSRPRLQPR